MKKFSVSFPFLTIIIFFILISFLQAQNQNKPAASLKASVSQTIGIDTEINIVYCRPGVKGRTIWGDLVPWGLAPGNKNSNNKPYPWRGGANENTTIQFSKKVLINGKKLSAGKYGMHFIPGKKEWTIIFSKNSNLWGSYQYNEAEDALRIKVIPKKTSFTEWLMYGFDNLAGTSTVAFLQWEKIKIPFIIKVSE